VYESPRNVCVIQRNKSTSSCGAASIERCPSLPGRNSQKKLEEANSRVNKKKSMTDSIDNIQERTSSAMSMASSAKMSAASASAMASESAASASAIARIVAGSERANKRGVCV
jgi:hypothetical protein